MASFYPSGRVLPALVTRVTAHFQKRLIRFRDAWPSREKKITPMVSISIALRNRASLRRFCAHHAQSRSRPHSEAGSKREASESSFAITIFKVVQFLQRDNNRHLFVRRAGLFFIAIESGLDRHQAITRA